jgi:Flp pilus assembly pilin Flp
MTYRKQLWRLWCAERGANAVEYVAVSGVALVIAGLIVAGLTAGSIEIGSVMATHHAAFIASFERGLDGTAGTDAAMHPQPDPIVWWHPAHMSQPMLGVTAPFAGHSP